MVSIEAASPLGRKVCGVSRAEFWPQTQVEMMEPTQASSSSQALLSTCWLLAALNELYVAEKQAGCLTPANMTIR